MTQTVLSPEYYGLVDSEFIYRTSGIGTYEGLFIVISPEKDENAMPFMAGVDISAHPQVNGVYLAQFALKSLGIEEDGADLTCRPNGIIRDAGVVLVSHSGRSVKVGGKSTYFGRADDENRLKTIKLFDELLSPDIEVGSLPY